MAIAAGTERLTIHAFVRPGRGNQLHRHTACISASLFDQLVRSNALNDEQIGRLREESAAARAGGPAGIARVSSTPPSLLSWLSS